MLAHTTPSHLLLSEELTMKTERYEGEVNSIGKKDGKGKCFYADGAVYEGEWKDGQRNGSGKFTYASGDIYEGNWQNDKKHGKGKYYFTLFGESYEGDFRDDKKNGKGLFIYANSDFYDGEFKDDKKHGFGKYFYSEEGSDLPDEHYKAKTKSKSSKKTLKRVNTFSMGEYYEGEWVADKKTGQGKYIYADGSCYDGTWLNDQQEGKGVFVFPDAQTSFKGVWKENELVWKELTSNPPTCGCIIS